MESEEPLFRTPEGIDATHNVATGNCPCLMLEKAQSTVRHLVTAVKYAWLCVPLDNSVIPYLRQRIEGGDDRGLERGAFRVQQHHWVHDSTTGRSNPEFPVVAEHAFG